MPYPIFILLNLAQKNFFKFSTVIYRKINSLVCKSQQSTEILKFQRFMR